MIARESLNLQTPYELPAGKLEELIAGIFAEVFERELDSSLADLLPRRRSQLVFEEHGEISTAKAASLMQVIFEAALAEEASPPPQEPSIGSMSLAAREA